MKRSSQTSLSAFGFKRARAEALADTTENTNEPVEIEDENSDTGTTSTSATVSINIGQSSQCAVTIQSTSANTTTSISSISSSTTCNTSTDGASITITVHNDISKSKDDHPVQPMKSSFPKKDMFGKMRSFQTSWYKEFPFIEYSKNNDAVYCFCCRHFPSLSGKHEDAFLSGFSNWHKAVEKLRKHSESVSHKNSMEMWANYMHARVSGTVVENIAKQSAIQTKENREYIKILAKVAILCAKQEIALRGHREGPESLNKGNFLEILDLLKSDNEWLDKRLASAAKNAKYTSPDIQNSLLQAACSAVLEGTKDEIHLAKYFAIMVDESRDISKLEQVSLCVRYCIESKVYERFLGFYDTERADAESLTSLITKALLDHGLDIYDCIAQCYDGASVMSGEHSGVQRRIQNIVEHCIYVHCHAHRLNLVLVSTARHIRSCEDFFGILQLLHSFFSVSGKRHSTFVQIQKDHQLPSMEIPGLSDTRWACRFQSVRVVKERLKCIIETLKYICDNSTDGQEKAEATGILTQMTTWIFLFHLILFFKLLGITNGLSQMLQSEALDLAGAVCLVSATLKTLKDYRREEKYLLISDDARELADSLNIPLVGSQRRSHRTRTPSSRLRDMIVLESTGDCTFEGEDVDKATYFAVIDKFIVEIKARFNDSEHILLAIAACNPKVSNFLDLEVLTPLITQYKLDLCKLENELPVAKAAIANAKDLQLETIADVIKFFIPMKVAFSELLKLLQIALTIPVTSASCERSFSALKRIKTYLRSRMGNERLSNLAVLAIEKEATNVIDLERVVDIFAEKNRNILLK